MGAALLLLGSALLGIGLTERLLGPRLSHVAHLFFGLVIGWAVTTAIAYAWALTTGGLSRLWLFGLLATVWLSALYLLFPKLRSKPVWTAGKEWLPLGALLLLLAPLYIVLFQTHMLRQGPDGGLYSGGTSTAYDIGFHAALITSFVYGGNFPPIYPAMPPAPLLYPALPDFQTALLVSLGLDLQTALVWTGVSLALALTAITYLFALALPANGNGRSGRIPPWTAIVTTTLVLFNGGLGFLYWNTSYSKLPEHGIVWPNLITDALLPQRTTLFGLCLALIVFTLFAMAWRESAVRNNENKWAGWSIFLVAGLITGLLPGFHPHSFGAVGIVSGFLFLLRPRRTWVVFWASALLLAAPYLVPFLAHMSGEGFVRFRPGWRGPTDWSWILFWIRNAGLPTLLIIPAWIAAERNVRLFYLAFAGLLVVSLLVIFSPNDYDNLKLLTYWQAATALLVANWLVRLAARSRLLAVTVVLLVFGCIASGILAVLYELRSRTLVFDRSEVAVAEFIRVQTPARSLFLTGPSLHQPVLSLAGRAVVRGPTAWLWSHGYPFAEREADVRAIYAGRGDAVELLRYYRVDYLYLGAREREELHPNQQFFERTFPAVYRDGDIVVYETRQPGAKNDPLAPYPVREFAGRVGRDPFQPLLEYREIGYPLYRQLTQILGRPPRYEEFMTNLKTVGRGVYPGVPGWQTVAEENRRKLSQASSPGANIDTPASTRDYNAAYVLLHYFGYLKRDVDADNDGYQYWVRELDRTGDYRSLTRAFIESEEYKAQTP
jgi:hypothetical protein